MVNSNRQKLRIFTRPTPTKATKESTLFGMMRMFLGDNQALQEVSPDGKRDALIILLLIAAIGFNGIVINLVGYGSAFDSVAVPSGQPISERYVFFAGSIIASLLLIPRSDSPSFPQLSLCVGAYATSICGLLALSLVASVSAAPPPVLRIIGHVFMGFGCIGMQLCGFRLVASAQSSIAVYVFAILKTLVSQIGLSFVQTYCPSESQFLVCFFLIAISFCSMLLAIRRCGKQHCQLLHAHPSSCFPNQALKSPTSYMLIYGASLLCVATYGISDNGIWGGSRVGMLTDPLALQGVALSTALFLVVAISSAGLAGRSHGPGSSSPFLIAITGFAAVLALDLLHAADFFQTVLKTALGLYCQVLSITIVLACFKQYPGFTCRMFGLYQTLTFSFALCWILLFEEIKAPISLAMLIVSYILMLVASCSDKKQVEQRGSLRQNANETNENAVEASEKASLILTRTYRLTPREQDVLLLLLQGRSLPYIEKKLVISNGTVRTHSRNIYRKLDVHSRQELLDLKDRVIANEQGETNPLIE